MVKIKTLNEQLKPSLMSMAIVPSRFSSTVKIGADGSINNNEETIIQLGRQGENNITSIIFDKSALNITAEEIKRDYIEELIFIQNGKDPIIQIFENGIYKVQEVITKTPGVYGIVYLLKEKNITSGDNKEIFTSAIFSGVVKSSIYEYKPVGELIEAPSAKDTKLEKPIINLQWNEDELDPSIQAAAKLGYRQDELVTKIQLAPLQCGITDPDEYDIYYYHPNYGSYAYKMNAGRFSWVPKEITDYAGQWQVAIAAKNNARNEVFFSDIIKLTVVENKLNEDTPLLVGIDELLKVDPAGPKPLLSEAEIAASKEFILSYTGQEVQELLDKVKNLKALSQATEEQLGGIKAVSKTLEDTQEVRIDTKTGRLFTKPSSLPKKIARYQEDEYVKIEYTINNYRELLGTKWIFKDDLLNFVPTEGYAIPFTMLYENEIYVYAEIWKQADQLLLDLRSRTNGHNIICQKNISTGKITWKKKSKTISIVGFDMIDASISDPNFETALKIIIPIIFNEGNILIFDESSIDKTKVLLINDEGEAIYPKIPAKEITKTILATFSDIDQFYKISLEDFSSLGDTKIGRYKFKFNDQPDLEIETSSGIFEISPDELKYVFVGGGGYIEDKTLEYLIITRNINDDFAVINWRNIYIDEMSQNLDDLFTTVTNLENNKQDKLIAGTGISIAEDGKTISAIDTGYKLPQATSNTLGGIKAALRTAEDTQEIKIDAQTGKLFTKPGSNQPIQKIKEIHFKETSPNKYTITEEDFNSFEDSSINKFLFIFKETLPRDEHEITSKEKYENNKEIRYDFVSAYYGMVMSISVHKDKKTNIIEAETYTIYYEAMMDSLSRLNKEKQGKLIPVDGITISEDGRTISSLCIGFKPFNNEEVK